MPLTHHPPKCSKNAQIQSTPNTPTTHRPASVPLSSKYSNRQFKPWIRVPLINDTTATTSSSNFYCPSVSKFDLYTLLPTQSNAFYLSKNLSSNPPATTRVLDQTWTEWLQAVTGARYFPRLLHGRALFADLQAILCHCPDKSLSTLQASTRLTHALMSRLFDSVRYRVDRAKWRFCTRRFCPRLRC